MENTRHIVDEEELTDKDADMEGEGKEIIHTEVESIVIRMATAHIPAVSVKHPDRNIRRIQPLQI